MLSTPEQTRRRWMGILAKASPAELRRVSAAVTPLPDYVLLRRPETGLVQVRGRTGGAGSPFNLGEMTVTRCSVRLDDGTVGHAWVAGRDAGHSELAAVLDALLQNPARRPQIEAAVVAPLEQTQQQQRAATARKAAATRVDFFTLVRGED